MRRRWNNALADGPPPAKPAAAIDAVVGDRDLLDVGVNRRGRVDGVEQLLAHAVGDRRPGEALVEQDRPVGDRFVELLERRMPMLGPLIRMPAAHRRDPLALRHALPAGRERFLDLADRRRVLEDRVVARAGSRG